MIYDLSHSPLPLPMLIPVLFNIEKGMVQRIVRINCVRRWSKIEVKVSALTAKMGLNMTSSLNGNYLLTQRNASNTIPLRRTHRTAVEGGKYMEWEVLWQRRDAQIWIITMLTTNNELGLWRLFWISVPVAQVDCVEVYLSVASRCVSNQRASTDIERS